jgi:hypothetical protein
MGKFTILVCGAVSACAVLAFLRPESFQDVSVVPVAAAVSAVDAIVPASLGMAGRFDAEKSDARQEELPQQF